MTIYRFSGFVFDDEDRRLERGDAVMELRPQLAIALSYFLQNAGQTIRKDALHREIWPNINVQDQNLALLISELRKVFDDDPKNPKWIKTVPKSGYRWMVPLNGNPSIFPKARWLQAVLLLTGTLLLVAGIFWWGLPHKSEPSGRNPVRIAFWPFENGTGDESLKWLELGLMDMVSESCATSNRIETVPTDKMLQHLRLNSKERKEPCRQLGVDVVISTRFEKRGSLFLAKLELSFQDGIRTERLLEDENLIQLANKVVEVVVARVAPRLPAFSIFEAFSSDTDLSVQYAWGLQTFLTEGPQSALPLFQSCAEKDEGFLRAKVQIAKCLRQLGRAEEAHRLLQTLIQQSRASENIMVEATSLGLLSAISHHQWDFQAAENNAVAAQQLFVALNEPLLIAVMDGQLGYIAYTQGQIPEAELKTKIWLKGARQAGDLLMEGQALNTLGMVMDGKSDWNQIQDYGEQAIHCFERLGSEPGIAQAKGNLGYFALKYGEWDKALVYLEQALNMQKKVGDQRAFLRLSLCMALYEGSVGNYDLGFSHLEQCLKWADVLQDQFSGFQAKILKIRFLADTRQPFDSELKELATQIRAVDYPEMQAQLALTQAYVACLQKEPETSHSVLEQMDLTFRKGPDYLFVLGLQSVMDGHPDQGATLFRRAQAEAHGDWALLLNPFIAFAQQVQAGQQPAIPRPGFHLR